MEDIGRLKEGKWEVWRREQKGQKGESRGILFQIKQFYKGLLLKTVQFEKDCSIGECQAPSSKCCDLHSSKIQGRGRVLMGISK